MSKENIFSIDFESNISEEDAIKIQKMIQLAFDIGVQKGLEERLQNVKLD